MVASLSDGIIALSSLVACRSARARRRACARSSACQAASDTALRRYWDRPWRP
jgi:hypothetical protein